MSKSLTNTDEDLATGSQVSVRIHRLCERFILAFLTSQIGYNNLQKMLKRELNVVEFAAHKYCLSRLCCGSMALKLKKTVHFY